MPSLPIVSTTAFVITAAIFAENATTPENETDLKPF
jgi:hypothetical protein